VSAPPQNVRVFRLPALTYLVVLFLFFGSFPLAFAGFAGESARIRIGWHTLILLVPLVAGFMVARTATVVTSRGIVVRAVFGRRALPWDSIRGLSVTGRGVYAVLADGSVRLPCVRVANLAEVARASDGRLPEIADPKPKYAPSRRRRR
jgi:hypothetical protein